jgi:hypothetical protein
MHIILGKKFQRLVHSGRPIQKQAHCRGGGEIRFAGVLIGLFRMLNGKNSHTQPFFVHTVQRCEDGRQHPEFVHEPQAPHIPAKPQKPEMA